MPDDMCVETLEKALINYLALGRVSGSPAQHSPALRSAHAFIYIIIIIKRARSLAHMYTWVAGVATL